MKRELPDQGTVNTAIIDAVAEVTGRQPESLQPFAESIDTDAIESLFTRSGDGGVASLELIYEGCHLVLTQDTVTVEEILTINDAPPASLASEPAVPDSSS